MADIFDVIADATRRELLRTLLERHVEGAAAPHGGEMSVGELVQALGLSQPTVSKHLRVLREIRLVTVREQGQHRFYKLDAEPLKDVEDWLRPFLGPVSTGNGGVDASEAARTVMRPGTLVLARRIGAAAGGAGHLMRATIERARRR